MENGSPDAGEAEATATKAWVEPASTPGQVTGGGQLVPVGSASEVSFGFEAKNGLELVGACSVVGPSLSVHVKCLDATALVQTGKHATFFGHGTPTIYRIDVDDLGEPGAGRDTFELQTGTGYTIAGVLARGN